MVLSACQPTPTQAPAPAQPESPAAATEAPAAPPATEAPAEPAAPEYPWAEVDPSGQTVIFWHQHTRAREEALLQIIDDFNATNEWGITVEASYQGSYNDIFNKMLAVLNTSDAPNVVVAYQNQAATYQLAEGLADMNPMIQSAKWGLSEEEQADFFPGFWAQDVFPTYGNARLGFPPNRSMEVLYYNADWLKELGYDGPPTTPEEFKEMACKAIEQPFSKATVDGSMGYELSVDASRFASFAFAFGGDVYDYNANKYTYDSEESVNAMSFLQEMFNEGCATIVTEAYGDQTDFGTGKLLFSVGSSSGLPFYRTAAEEGAGFEWSVAAIPHTTPDPVMNIYGASVSIPKTTPEGELAAWLFIKYYTDTESQATWAKASEYFPVRASVAEGLADYFAENPAYKTAFDMLEFGRFEPPTPGYDVVRTKVGEAMAAIADGADVASTLKALNDESNIILAEQMTSPLPTPVPTEPPKEEVKVDFKACQVTDTGGIDDKSFNATAWKGITDAIEQLGIEGKYLESQQQTDYEKNINAFIEEGCNLIVTVGFLLGDATKALAEANPEQKFSIVDYAYDPAIPNVLGQVFNTQEAGFLAGYLAAGVSQTGVVGTFGGMQIPTVTVFMDGFVLGVNYYNEVKGTSVTALGWDPATQTGLFTGNFESADDGRTMAENLMDEGADIIMPVAGPVGLGSAAAAQERGNVYIIGVDSDWYLTAPNYSSIILTSVMKMMDTTTMQAIQAALDGSFAGGVTVGTLENGGVGLAPFHDLESMVPAELIAELDDIKAKLIAGEISAIP
jgi:basic membrane lipoprotein Med (substrate-binding protein (PBP1-ABC) superfamily)/ABC-type glycerol-3-phosphate transport system substrate-binding protein